MVDSALLYDFVVFILFSDFAFFIYGIIIFLLINRYKPSSENFNWIAIGLTGISTAVLYALLILPTNAGRLFAIIDEFSFWSTKIIHYFLGGLITAFLTNLFIFLIKKYKK